MKKNKKGSLTISLLTISASFIIIILALLMLLTNQFDYTMRQEAHQQALNIAEAGINYYRWHLAHDQDDFQDGTDNPGPYIHDYHDPQGKQIGQYSLEIIPPDEGSTVVTIKSTGWHKEYPNIKRTITAKLGLPSITQYSSLNNTSLWFGSGITVHGLIHSNNGIRMDGVNTSIVSSARETYTCGTETGCSPSQERPGVWGSGPGGDQGLWEFPVANYDFEGINLDFLKMRQAAQDNGLYLQDSQAQGYHLIFSDQYLNVRRVTDTDYTWGYSSEQGCERLYQYIDSEETVGNYDLSETPIVFAEDNLWVEGTVEGRVTVIAARFPLDNNNMNIWIDDNLQYESHDDHNRLGLIAQNDIYFSRNIPNDFVVEGALMAVKGHIIRHGYFWWCGWYNNAVRNSLTVYGTLISNLKPYWNYGTSPTSGFETRTHTYDSSLLYNPPPYFPTQGEYNLIYWKED